MKAPRVLLNHIHHLEFKSGEKTTGRRLSPVDQMNCIGYGCNQNLIESIKCTNINVGGSEPEWHCKLPLHTNFRIGRTQISCEGYDDSSDPFVLIGSCGLTYELISKTIPKQNSHNTSYLGMLFIIVFIFIFGSIVGIAISDKFKKKENNNLRYNAIESIEQDRDDPPEYSLLPVNNDQNIPQISQANVNMAASNASYPSSTPTLNHQTSFTKTLLTIIESINASNENNHLKKNNDEENPQISQSSANMTDTNTSYSSSIPRLNHQTFLPRRPVTVINNIYTSNANCDTEKPICNTTTTTSSNATIKNFQSSCNTSTTINSCESNSTKYHSSRNIPYMRKNNDSHSVSVQEVHFSPSTHRR